MITAIPMASISAQKIVLYDELDGIRRGGQTSEASRANLEDNSHHGEVSQAAAKRIIASVNWLYALSSWKRCWLPKEKRYVRFRLNLFTLTLPSVQCHSDIEIKQKCLEPFLQIMRRKYGMKSYLWKAEPQKNGNIHFHLTSNCFVYYRDCQTIWNECLDKLGYVARYTAASGKTNPPSIEVRAVQHVRKLAAYIAEYLTKKSTVREIQGRQWFRSSNLTALKPGNYIAYGSLNHEISAFGQAIKAPWKKGEYATVIFADIFSKKMDAYPELNAIKNELIAKYKHTIS